MLQIEFNLDYEMKKKKTTLCMCHGPGMYDAAVDVTWVPCSYLKK